MGAPRWAPGGVSEQSRGRRDDRSPVESTFTEEFLRDIEAKGTGEMVDGRQEHTDRQVDWERRQHQREQIYSLGGRT